MKVYISVDMEGIAGVATYDQIFPAGRGYSEARALMTAEANAAIEGAFDAGAVAVTVNDSHGQMDNLLFDELDPRARLIFGTPKAQCMAQGMNSEFDAALFVGYHGAAGSTGVLSHTISSEFHRVLLNGHEVSEADINALYAADLGIPVAFLSGDDIICGQSSRLLPSTTKVAVKHAAGYTAADSLSPATAAEKIRQGVATSLSSVDDITLPTLDDAWVLEVDMLRPTAAEFASMIPGCERVSVTRVRHSLTDISEVLSLISVWALFGSSAMSKRLVAH